MDEPSAHAIAADAPGSIDRTVQEVRRTEYLDAVEGVKLEQILLARQDHVRLAGSACGLPLESFGPHGVRCMRPAIVIP